jgi:hypothetical protein
MARKHNKAAEKVLLAALAMGATVENAARKANISERTVYRWLGDPGFQARIEQQKRENMVRTAGMLGGAAMASVKTLVDLQQDVAVAATVRRGAARDILEMAVKYRESTELEQRLMAIEDRLSPGR